MNSEDVPCYIGFKTCGCAVSALVDDPKEAGDKTVQKVNAKEIARMVKDGLTIERKTVGWARSNLKMCKCEKVVNS